MTCEFRMIIITTNMSLNRRIFLARHGERIDHIDASWRANPANGFNDPPLTETGIDQAQDLGQHLINSNITTIISSPFSRTIQTAHECYKILSKDTKIHFLVETGLCEWMNGWLFPRGDPISSIMSPTELSDRYPQIDCSYQSRVYVVYPESATEFRRRAYMSALALLRTLQGTTGNVLAVTHGAVIEVVTDILTKVSIPSGASYCSLTEIVLAPEPAPQPPNAAIAVLAQHSAGPRQLRETSSKENSALLNRMEIDPSTGSSTGGLTERLLTLVHGQRGWHRILWSGLLIRRADDSFLKTPEQKSGGVYR